VDESALIVKPACWWLCIIWSRQLSYRWPNRATHCTVGYAMAWLTHWTPCVTMSNLVVLRQSV